VRWREKTGERKEQDEKTPGPYRVGELDVSNIPLALFALRKIRKLIGSKKRTIENCLDTKRSLVTLGRKGRREVLDGRLQEKTSRMQGQPAQVGPRKQARRKERRGQPA